MLASETRAGFRLVDVLSRKYDVVAANPPYMGSKNMGPALKKHVDAEFKAGKQDAYAAFILRALQLSQNFGRIAFVVPQTWLALETYTDFRSINVRATEEGQELGLLRRISLELLVHLGRHAFSEVDPPSNVVMSIMSLVAPSETHCSTCIRMILPADSSQQARVLTQATKAQLPNLIHRPKQAIFLSIKGAPFVYWLSDRVLKILTNSTELGVFANVGEGLSTSHNERFLRMFWETPIASENTSLARWTAITKGGGYRRWFGFDHYSVDWGSAGIRVKLSIIERYPYLNGGYGFKIKNESDYMSPALTYSTMASGALAVRKVRSSAFDNSGSYVCLKNHGSELGPLGALLNSRLTTHVLRAITQSRVFKYKYVQRVPLPANTNWCSLDLAKLTDEVFQAAENERGSAINERSFRALPTSSKLVLESDVFCLLKEGILEDRIFNLYELDEVAVQSILSDTGVPSGWQASAHNYEAPVPLSFKNETTDVVSVSVPDHRRMLRKFSDANLLNRHRIKLRELFEAGPDGAVVDEASDVDEADESEFLTESEGGRPIPPNSFLDALCQKLALNPISVYWLIKEGTEKSGWRCLPVERSWFCDQCGVSILRLLGHRWPKQIEANEPVPDWFDADGIIPLTAQTHEATLYDRVQQRFTADKINANDFASVIGKPLDAWLASDFFKHHIQQFKRRPIAWQLQSGSFTARSTPAFACLIYYHKLDVDALPKLCSQYIGPLRRRLETEQRGILSIAKDARSDRQAGRLLELEGALAELQRFDATLETVATDGFGPAALLPTLRQYALNDAMSSVKRHWCRRLSDVIARTALQDWLTAAARTGLHPDFGAWIADAIRHLDHGCVQVGPQAPEQKNLQADPSTADLARVISPHAPAMLSGALALACDAWWNLFDDIVLAPLKVRFKEMKAEQKRCDERLKSDPEPPLAEARDLRACVKELKADAKELTAEITEKTARAAAIRKQIESWRSTEPATWSDWLAEQPLFDAISSLDGRRAPPATIAEFIAQESLYAPDINDGVRVNVAPLQKAGLLAADVLAAKDLDKAIADRAEWRADERRWVREGKLPKPGWWPENVNE